MGPAHRSPRARSARSTVIANAEQWVYGAARVLPEPQRRVGPGHVVLVLVRSREQPGVGPLPLRLLGLRLVGVAARRAGPRDRASSRRSTRQRRRPIDCTDMQPGDAANRNPDTGHIVIFEKWVTPGQEALFFEEPGCSSSTPYAHEFHSAVTCSGSTVNIAYEGDTFTAIRYNNIVDDSNAAGRAAAVVERQPSGSSSGGSTQQRVEQRLEQRRGCRVLERRRLQPGYGRLGPHLRRWDVHPRVQRGLGVPRQHDLRQRAVPIDAREKSSRPGVIRSGSQRSPTTSRSRGTSVRWGFRDRSRRRSRPSCGCSGPRSRTS